MFGVKTYVFWDEKTIANANFTLRSLNDAIRSATPILSSRGTAHVVKTGEIPKHGMMGVYTHFFGTKNEMEWLILTPEASIS